MIMRRVLSIGAGGMLALVAAAGAVAAEKPPVNGGVKPAIHRSAASPTAAAAAAAAVAAPRPQPMEQLFAPIAPCRVFSIPVPAQRTRAASVTGDGDFTGQGGPAGGCGIPAAATAVSITLHAEAAATGAAYVFPGGGVVPTSATLHYRGSQITTTGATTELGPTGRLVLYTSTAATLTGSITGYYIPQIQVYMNVDGTPYAATNRIVGTSKLGVGSYRIDTDRNLQLCSVHVNVDGGTYYSNAYPTGNSIFVSTWRIEGGVAIPTDLYHNVSVKC
jgi:hypothetical protein